MNVQNRLTALTWTRHWYPSDVEQPHGRIIRQRNRNKVVRIKWYATRAATTHDHAADGRRGSSDSSTRLSAATRRCAAWTILAIQSIREQAATLASGDRALQLAGLRQGRWSGWSGCTRAREQADQRRNRRWPGLSAAKNAANRIEDLPPDAEDSSAASTSRSRAAASAGSRSDRYGGSATP